MSVRYNVAVVAACAAAIVIAVRMGRGPEVIKMVSICFVLALAFALLVTPDLRTYRALLRVADMHPTAF
jgi:hypothetical protein